ncbi:hypothetical protein AAG906_000675 [Vitis piasezkii]
MTLTRAFEKLRDGGLIVPLAPCPLPHPIPPHFRSHEHCLYHRVQGTTALFGTPTCDTDLIDLGLGSIDMGTSFCSDLARAPFILIMVAIEPFSLAESNFSSLDIYTLFLLIRYVHPFIITFGVGTPRFGTHDVFYALHFMHEGSHVGNSRDWSEIISWSMMDEDLSWVMDFYLSWSIVTSDGLYCGIATSFTFIEPGILIHMDYPPYWILYTGAYPSFGGRSDCFFTLEHLPTDMEIIGLFHVVLIAYWGIAT